MFFIVIVLLMFVRVYAQAAILSVVVLYTFCSG